MTIWDKIKYTLIRNEKSFQRHCQEQAKRAALKARLAEVEELLADPRYAWYRGMLVQARDAVISMIGTASSTEELLRLSGKLDVLDMLIKYPDQMILMLQTGASSGGGK